MDCKKNTTRLQRMKNTQLEKNQTVLFVHPVKLRFLEQKHNKK